MPTYQEYCPLGLTDKTREFEIKGDRVPSPTTPCICGGTEEEKITADAASRATMFGAVAINQSIDSGGKPVVYKEFKANIHRSAIRKLD